MSMRLSDRPWRPFKFTDVFIIRKGFYNKHPLFTNNGIVPFIGATESNNGITGMTTWPDIESSSKVGYGPNEPLTQKRFPGNCICVTNNGSVGYAYYQATDFTCSHDINPLYLKDRELSKHLALFIITCIEKQRVCFEYARKWRPKRMIKSRLMLPISDDGQPDYSFMEAFMKKSEELALQSYNKKLNQLGVSLNLNSNKQWKLFRIDSIFDNAQRGKRLKTQNHILGDKVYVSSSAENNGVDAFIGNTNRIRAFRDCITIANSGSVGKAFYHPYSFIASDHVTSLTKNGLSKYTYLFLTTILTQQLTGKYSFNREISDKRLGREQIMLPVSNDGQPDFEYMDSYMRYVEQKQLKEYLHFKSKI